MRMEDLRYLIQVAESGSISQAAETCYITQQGLSRIISSLEKELGVALFHRSSNHIRLTDMGEIVVARARELDALYQRMLNDISRDSVQQAGFPPVDYHIYTTQLISSTLLSRVLSALNPSEHCGAHAAGDRRRCGIYGKQCGNHQHVHLSRGRFPAPEERGAEI